MNEIIKNWTNANNFQFKLIESSIPTDILRVSKTNYGHIRKNYTLTYQKSRPIKCIRMHVSSFKCM
jgi:hypothetical protein